jgi:hypothetical protein
MLAGCATLAAGQAFAKLSAMKKVSRLAYRASLAALGSMVFWITLAS